MATPNPLALLDAIDIEATREAADALFLAGFERRDIVGMLVEAADRVIVLPPGRVGDAIERYDAPVIRALIGFVVALVAKQRRAS